MSDLPQPLAGIRVLDAANFLAGPFAGAILGEFGAEVIKVEQPGTGDPTRRFGTPSKAGDSLVWLSEARNKKSVTLNLRDPDGAALFKRLVERSDVVLENFRPGTLEKWGLGYEQLSALNPGLIMLRISGYGQTGPKRGEPGFARIAHAFCGLAHLVGVADGPPLMPGSTSLADYVTGTYGALGILLALRVKESSGEGQYIDLALYEPMFRMLDEIAPAYAQEGFVRQRMGADTVNVCPHSHYPTADGKWVAIACTTDKMFARLAQTMGRPELAAPESYGPVQRRLEQREQVNALVAEWSATMSQAELLEKCRQGDVPCGPINDIADIFADPQFAARGNLVEMDDPRAGKVTVPSTLPRLSKTPGRLNTLGPALAAHNEEIFGELLGLSPEELRGLRSKGAI